MRSLKGSGEGTIYSFSTVYRPPSAEFKDDVPYTVVLVELSEGPRMPRTPVELAPDAVRIGQRVQIIYDRVTEVITLPRFRPLASGASTP